MWAMLRRHVRKILGGGREERDRSCCGDRNWTGRSSLCTLECREGRVKWRGGVNSNRGEGNLSVIEIIMGLEGF